MHSPGQHRRIKSYTAETGMVYEHAFVTARRVLRWTGRGTEYDFDVEPARARSFRVSIRVPDRAVRAWEREHVRALSSTERYTAAKMRLFALFDESERVVQDTRAGVDSRELAALLDSIDIE